MRRRFGLVLFCLFAASFLVSHLSRASVSLSVTESAIRFLSDGERTGVELPFENRTGRDTQARIRLEFVDPQNRVRTSAEREAVIKQGATSLFIPLPLELTGLKEAERSQLLWYRLRYRITTASGNSTGEAIEGTVSLSEIASAIFDLRIAASDVAREGMLYRMRVLATHPLTGRAVEAVNVEAKLSLETESDEQVASLAAQGVTDVEGYATLDFNLPGDLRTYRGELKVMARRGAFSQASESSIMFDYQSRIFINTDKPLYQPGQILHARALVFSPAMRAEREQKTTLKITDPEDTVVFRTELETSRFGIASADWPIPENARLGEYTVSFGRNDDSYAYHRIKISRYDRPNFTVNVKPDRPFYLPGQNAEVEVRADYLFGHPVKRGLVRVVRETEREWNYREQKWETEEGKEYKGKLDEAGRFVARINLSEEHEDFKDDSWRRFEDLTYAAYLTDTSTGRTEQRRFDLRLTKEAIHVYVISDRYDHSTRLPLEFYLSTFYADGSPAQCEVELSEGSAQDEDSGRIEKEGRRLAHVTTNRFGLAKVTNLKLPISEERGYNRAYLRLKARDARGVIGHQVESFYFQDRPAIHVATDRTLYRTGEPLKINLTSSEPVLTVMVDVVRNWQVVRSELVRLRGHRAALTLPYDGEFRDQLSVTAYAITNAHDYIADSYTVLYPRDHELKLNVQPAQSTYRPGEEARVQFNVRTPDGLPIESALGVVVFDRAVEERARTDREFGSGFNHYGNYYNLLGYGDSLAGVSRKDLEQLDLSKSLPAELEVLAEVLLNKNGYYRHNLNGGDAFELSQPKVFADLTNAQIKPVKDAVSARYNLKSEYPADESSLRRILNQAGVDFDKVLDPWGTPYRAYFSVEKDRDVVTIKSAGADERFETVDDFEVAKWFFPYFRRTGDIIDRAVTEHHLRTKSYIRDAAIFKAELLRAGVDLDALRDPWGSPFKLEFDISGVNYLILVKSAGPNRRFDDLLTRERDDCVVWTNHVNYFADKSTQIDEALTAYLKKTRGIPQNMKELRAALRASKINFDTMLDAWGKPYYATFKTEARYADRVTVVNVIPSTGKQRTEIMPVTRRTGFVTIRSAGADGKEGTVDDFDAEVFSLILSENASRNAKPQTSNSRAIHRRGKGGMITGTVKDVQDAVVPNATVKATDSSGLQSFETTTDDEGRFVLRNLPVGTYEVRIESPGFMIAIVTELKVSKAGGPVLDITLQVGATTETVTVTSGSDTQVQTSSSQVGFSLQIKDLPMVSKNAANMVALRPGAQSAQASTPRLREYFPETLLWQPSLETDTKGRASLSFKLADNITTWKLAVIGSTATGEIGTAEKEIRSFQPFFVEHDPPRMLTEGDEIALPVVLRNYLDKSQRVALEIKSEDWFQLLGAAQKRAVVPAGDNARQIFDFRAIASINDGKQRITATGAEEANDAIEKPVSVHPHGEERAQTASGIFRDALMLETNVPMNAIKGTPRAELKIYPNLLAHVVESVESIMQRPYGCGEQTISSAYPSLLTLQYYKRAGRDAPVVVKARRYVQAAYERLLNYQASDGGFSYWGRGEADIALTAYALKFLHEAREFISVDEEVIKETREWLIKHQRADGSWPPARTWWETTEDQRRTSLLTAYVARILARIDKRDDPAKSFHHQQAQANQTVPAALKRALAFLTERYEKVDEPYLIASTALAAQDAGEGNLARLAVLKLLRLAKEEDGTIYWALETNTPFYGWGLAGRIETTALALQAITKHCGIRNADCGFQNPVSSNPQSAFRIPQLIDKGLLFLLRAKDRYGVWYSTQATINVLDTLVMLLSKDADDASDAGGQTEVFVNGQRAQTIQMPSGDKLTSPLTVDLSQFIAHGANKIELRRASRAAHSSVQIVTTYYVPWSVKKDANHGAAANDNSLRFSVSYDKPTAAIGEEVTCRVEAERVGFKGYGMMLGEIGLPPGADVDRASLELAMKDSGWSFSQYDILPDRLIVYLWPRGGGTRFSFKFRPRFGIVAQTAPSLLYDYYNPEARTVLAPTKFVVK